MQYKQVFGRPLTIEERLYQMAGVAGWILFELGRFILIGLISAVALVATGYLLQIGVNLAPNI
jgi:hypothetical protein